ncbi:MAG: hypothetical protein V3W17_06580, partial [Desulfobacteria bacterium]
PLGFFLYVLHPSLLNFLVCLLFGHLSKSPLRAKANVWSRKGLLWGDGIECSGVTESVGKSNAPE